MRFRLNCTLLMLVSAVTVAGAGCASAPRGSQSKAASCPSAERDSVFAAAGPVYRDCAVDVRAKNLTRPRLDYRPTSPPRNGACYSAEIEFVVNAKGVPETNTARVVYTNDQGLAEATIASLSGWRYEPARLGDVPVRQIVTEKNSMSAMVVMVPQGSAPTRPNQRPPVC
jgi:hypothetical protein